MKSRIYAQANIQEYWVVNLKTKTVTVFRSSIEGLYKHEQTFSQGELTPVLIPDISISIERLVS